MPGAAPRVWSWSLAARALPGGRGVRAVLGAVLIALAASPSLAQELNRQVQDVLDRAKLGANVGVSIVDVGTDTALARVNEAAPLMPASNMKLLTGGAALLVLGKDFEFRTCFYQSGGRLIVEGAGDPAFADPELLDSMKMGVAEFVGTIARSIGAAGGKGFTEVIVDDRVFDRQYVNPGWPADQLSRWYCAEVSGLNFHTNILQLYASPGQTERESPRLRTEPAAGGGGTGAGTAGPWIEIKNHATTTRAAGSSLWAEREAGANVFTVRGSVRNPLDEPVDVTMHEPSLVFGRMLADRLSAAGLGEAGVTISARLADPGEKTGVKERCLAVVQTPLEVVLRRCNVDSHNLYAECLAKRLGFAVTGQPGSWASGAAVVRMQVRDKIGPDAAAALTLADGSGMSRDNKVTAQVLAEWLAVLARGEKDGAAMWVESLPLAGREGTMLKRFSGRRLVNEVRAKSGYIAGVRCLSGYVTSRATGRRIAFSVLVNSPPGSAAGGGRVKDFHEDVVDVIDKWLAAKEKGMAEAEVPGGATPRVAAPVGKPHSKKAAGAPAPGGRSTGRVPANAR